MSQCKDSESPRWTVRQPHAVGRPALCTHRPVRLAFPRRPALCSPRAEAGPVGLSRVPPTPLLPPRLHLTPYLPEDASMCFLIPRGAWASILWAHPMLAEHRVCILPRQPRWRRKTTSHPRGATGAGMSSRLPRLSPHGEGEGHTGWLWEPSAEVAPRIQAWGGTRGTAQGAAPAGPLRWPVPLRAPDRPVGVWRPGPCTLRSCIDGIPGDGGLGVLPRCREARPKVHGSGFLLMAIGGKEPELKCF